MSTQDPYFCISCGHKGVHNGIIQITTPCEKCNSILIVPLASLHLMDIDALSISIPELLAEEERYKNWRGRKHLRVVPNDAEVMPEVTKNGTGADDEKEE